MLSRPRNPNRVLPLGLHYRNIKNPSGFAGGTLLRVIGTPGIAVEPLPFAAPRAKKRGRQPSSSSPRKEPLLLLDRIKHSTTLNELLTIIEQNDSHLGANEVRESLLRASKLQQEERRSLSDQVRNRLRRVVSQHLERHITERTSDYDAFSLAFCAHKLAKMRVGRTSTFNAIEKEALVKMRGFKPRGIANLLWAYATAGAEAPQLFEAVDNHLQSNPGLLDEFKPQGFSNTLWAFAKSSAEAPQLFTAVERHIQSHQGLLDEFKPQQLSNLLWAFAKSSSDAPQLFEAVYAHLQSHRGLLDEFNPQNFSNLLWAYATAQAKAPKLFEAVYAHLQANPGLLGDFTPQGFSNLLWAYATAGEKAPKLFEAVYAHLQANPGLLKGFQPQGFSMLLWAYATDEEKAPKLFEAVDAHLQANPGLLKGFDAQSFSMLLWAYATAGENAPKLFEAVDAHLQADPGLLRDFTPQGFSNLLWAYATAEEKATKLFDAMDAHLEANPGLLDRFKPQEFSMLLWAYAQQGHGAHGLFDLISKHIAQRLDEFNPQSLSMVLRAYAVLYHPFDDNVIQGALQRAMDEPSEFTPQDLANIMNAAVVFEKLDAETLKVLVSAMASTELQEEEYCSVFQSCLGVQLTSPDSSPESLLSGPMHDSAKSLWQEQAKDVRQSALQNNVLEVLRDQMGLTCHPEWMTPDGLFSVDIMVELLASNSVDEDTDDKRNSISGIEAGNGGQPTRVAVEVDGPTHFTSTRPFKALGSTRLRRRLLEARVDRVVSVPFYDWDAADSVSAKKTLLESLIFS